MPPSTRLRRWLPAAALLLCFAVAAAQQWMVWDWFIEDSAISFSYARNWVAGEGLVPWPGGERVEGYSNPAWVALIALGEIAGKSGFDTTKWLALGLTAVALFASWQVARLALPPADRHTPWPLLAPALLATHSAFNSWAGSGLENSLFGAVLLLAVWRHLTELRDDLTPWSPLLWLLLALTRPEGLLYAAVAGGWFALATWRAGRGLAPSVRWFLTFWVPGAALLAARLAYFAWPLPMTYYGKIGTGGPQLLHWDSRGWVQLRTYGELVWEAWYIPLYLVGLLGLSGRSRWLAALAAAGLAACILGGQPAGIALIAIALPFAALSADRWEARTLLWSMAATSVLFPAYANGDWMRGYRWMSLLAPSAAVLLTLGLRDLVGALAPTLPTAWRGLAATALPALFLGGLWAPKHLENARWFASEGKNESPHRIKRRVVFTQELWRKLYRDEQLVNMDMDMGAFTWFGDQWMVDMAGLLDVPIAVHSYADRAFLDEYITKERRPHLAHVHGHWERTSQFPEYTAFARDWFELPPWRDGPVRMHPGEYLRRDLLFSPQWEGPKDREVVFATGARIRGWSIPAAPISRGRAFFLEVGVQTTQRIPGREFRMVAHLSNHKGVGVSWDLPLTDELLPMEHWRAYEVFHGRYALEIPGDLPLGSWDLGFSLVGPRGGLLPAQGPHSVPADQARFGRGEARFPDAVRVVKFARADDRANEGLDAALAAADKGLCRRAEELWRESWLAIPKNHAWRADRRRVIGAALARCWALEADQDPDQAVDWLAKARGWSHDNATALQIGTPIADRLYAEGLAARADEDWDIAYLRFSEVLQIQPWRSWARRYAEEARNHRLDLGPLPIWGRSRRPEKTAPPP